MAKVLRLHEYNKGLDGIRLDDIKITEPGYREVRIDVDVFALNYGDFEMFEDEYTFTLGDLPARFGDECSGVISAIGLGVTEFKVGDKVSSLPWMNAGFGIAGEFAIVPADFVSHYPDNLSAQEAASVWIAYLTAYYPLFDVAKIKEGDYVLITAASSSAGIAAMEFCKLVGAKTIGTSRSHNNEEFLTEIGFDYLIAQCDGALAPRIMEITAGAGVNVVYDPIGGPIVQDYANAFAQNAMVFIYGGMDPEETVLPSEQMYEKSAIVNFYSLYNYIYDKAARERGVEFCYQGFKSKKLRAFVEKTYAIEEFKNAFAYQQQATTRSGKILILPKS